MSYAINRKRFTRAGAVLAALTVLSVSGFAYAAALAVPNAFTSGTTISAADMNANFTAVKTANDDNDSRIANLEARKITVVGYSGGNNGYNSPTTATQYTYITPTSMAFTKNSATSTIQVIWNDALMGRATVAGLGYCIWDVRIDGTASNPTSMMYWPVFTTSDTAVPISVTATYAGLPAGSHNVQFWLNTINAGCYINPGGSGRSVTVVEIP